MAKFIGSYGRNSVGIYDANKKRQKLLHVVDFHAVLTGKKEGDLRIIKIGYDKFVGIKEVLVKEYLELSRNNTAGIDFVARAEQQRMDREAYRDVMSEIHQNVFTGSDF